MSLGLSHQRVRITCASDWQRSLCSSSPSRSLRRAASKPQPHKTNSPATTTPIQHVIVIVGENRSFDHVFATYIPKNGQTINNLLSEGIITLDVNKTQSRGRILIRPSNWPLPIRVPTAFSWIHPSSSFPATYFLRHWLAVPAVRQGTFPAAIPAIPTPRFQPSSALDFRKPGCDGGGYFALISGGTGLMKYTPDTRITDVTSLPAGPFQITNGSSFAYNDYAQSPVHRFYQMWQQMNCNLAKANAKIPPVAPPIYSLGWKRLWAQARMAHRSRHSALPIMIRFPASPPIICPTSPSHRPRAKGRPPWRPTTYSKVTFPTSPAWRKLTP